MLPFDLATHLHTPTTAFLTWCAVQDARHRRITNTVWLVGLVVLAPLRVYAQFATDIDLTLSIAWGVGLTLTALLMWGMRAWGGADAKGIMLLAWITPPFTAGPVTAHPLLYAIPLSLIGVLAWQRIDNRGAPFYALLAPALALGFLVLWLTG